MNPDSIYSDILSGYLKNYFLFRPMTCHQVMKSLVYYSWPSDIRNRVYSNTGPDLN